MSEYGEILETCDRYRKKFNIVVPFNDAYELIYKVGGHIRESLNYEDSAGDIRREGESFWITLNGNIDERYKIIAVAQLIGVLCLYTPYCCDDEAWMKCPEINITKTDAMDKAGYEFAKELLLPGYLFFHIFAGNVKDGKINLKDLAKAFNLPVQFIKERAIDLGMIKLRKEKEDE